MEPTTATTRRGAAGFTLVELLTIVIILGLLITMTMPSIVGVRKQFRVEETRGFLAQLDAAIRRFQSEVGFYPPSDGSPMTDPRGNPLANWPTDLEGREALVQFLTGYLPADGGKADGRDGPGFRRAERGVVYGPYVPAGEQIAGQPPVFVDSFRNEILYYRYDDARKGYTDDNASAENKPDNINDYLTGPDDRFYRADYVLITPGPDRRYDADENPVETDDLGNFGHWWTEE